MVYEQTHVCSLVCLFPVFQANAALPQNRDAFSLAPPSRLHARLLKKDLAYRGEDSITPWVPVIGIVVSKMCGIRGNS